MPVFKLTTSSAFDVLKQSTQSQLLIELHGLLADYAPDVSWPTGLAEFFSYKPTIIVPPPKVNAESRMFIKLLNSAVKYTPLKHLGQAIVSIDNITVR